jgi:hypothetical protein
LRKFPTCIFVVLLAFTLTACNKSNGNESAPAENHPKKPYRLEEAVKNGDVVNLHGKIHNLDRFERFASHVENEEEDQIRITSYTDEGDPVFYHLVYDGEKIQYTFDNSQDAFAGSERGKQSTTCSKLEKRDTDRGVEYRLSGCASKVGETFYFRVEK